MNFELAIQYNEHITWENTSCVNTLTDDEVVIWKISCSLFSKIYPFGKTMLAPVEIERGKRFYRSKDADLFLTSRIALRILAGFYMNMDPKHVRFKTGDFSKPYLATDVPSLYFNVSHSDDLVLIAFSASEVGIDLEKLNRKLNIHSLLNAVFTDEERSYIEQNQYDSQRRFYLLWTRKECLLKQTGKGLTDHMNLIPVLNGRHQSLQNHLQVQQQGLQIISFPITADYIASVCIDQHIKSIQYREFRLGHFIL